MLSRITKLTVLTAAFVPLCLFVALMLCNYRSIAYGVTVSGYGIGGKNIAEAKQSLAQNAAYFEYTKTALTLGDRSWKAAPRDLGVTFDIDATVQKAYRVGRNKNMLGNVIAQMRIATLGTPVSFTVTIDDRALDRYLDEHLKDAEQKATNAALVFNEGTGVFEITPAHTGSVINKSLLKYALFQSAARGIPATIALAQEQDAPLISEEALEPIAHQANQLLARAPLALTYATSADATAPSPARARQHSLTKEQLKDLITPVWGNDIFSLGIREEVLKNILIELAPSINQKPQNAVLTFTDGKAKEFALSKNGIELDIPASIEAIKRQLAQETQAMTLAVNTLYPEIRTETIENLGLVTLLGKGESDFSGSPSSRIFNIKLGAEKLNGTFIKPGEEFSFMNAIGDVSAKEGYQYALVIKNGGDLVKEYGGGLCQVSTTMFRAAIYAGLTITERFAHSLPVRYYNPQGFDAAVYSPHPDLRFINDTPSNILVQTKIKGNKLYFEFYGTSDTREVKLIGPREYDRDPDGSFKTILTREIYKDGALIDTDVFRSSYRSPKQAPAQKNPLE
ncbi:VanW family protein [Candidatus Azambacteria bacterium]|nr:VanW family protein [Candidatus Azambacteria bacterium]